MKHIGYFAYGSNLSTQRLEARVGRVRVLGRAHLSDHILTFNKRGADGSAKANAVARPGAVLEGVIFELTFEQLSILDDIEGGYRRTSVRVSLGDKTVSAETYIALPVFCEEGLSPTEEYLSHCRRGAREHGTCERLIPPPRDQSNSESTSDESGPAPGTDSQ